MKATTAEHPAKFSESILMVIADTLLEHQPKRVLDPFAGTGRIHWLAQSNRTTIGVELEPEWARGERNTIQANALALPFPAGAFDAMVTSPCYGNRMSDHHDARDSSKRNTYRHTLGRPLHKDNAGQMQWGSDYRDLHDRVWTECLRVLAPDSLVVINVSNHIRKGVEQRVSEWHLTWWLSHGCKLLDFHTIDTRRQRQGANRELRVAFEAVVVMRTKGLIP